MPRRVLAAKAVALGYARKNDRIVGGVHKERRQNFIVGRFVRRKPCTLTDVGEYRIVVHEDVYAIEFQILSQMTLIRS